MLTSCGGLLASQRITFSSIRVALVFSVMEKPISMSCVYSVSNSGYRNTSPPVSSRNSVPASRSSRASASHVSAGSSPPCARTVSMSVRM